MSKKPKILLYDLETTALEAYVWGTYQVNAIAIKKEWEILSFSYKWHGNKKVYFRQHNGKSDKALCEELWKLFNKADMVVAHNLKKFDKKKANARFMKHKLPPYRPPAELDTLAFAKYKYKFTSNSLGNLGEFLGFGDKVKNMPFELWLGCIAGDKKCWRKMKKYNNRDVLLLEDIFDVFSPWMGDYMPMLSLISGNKRACSCGSYNLQKMGFLATKTSRKQRYRCLECGCTYSAGASTGLKWPT